MSEHVRSNVVGYVAVFIALSGTAAALPGKNSVDSGDIANKQVKTKDLADGAVTNPKLAGDSVDSSKVGADTLTGQDLDESTLDTAVLQTRVGSSCASGSAISSIAANGSVTCEQGGGPPSGQAGGDLTGSYPNPTVAPDAIGTNEVDASLTAADIANSDTLGTAEINEGDLFNDNSLNANDIDESSLGLAAGRTSFGFNFLAPSPPGSFGQIDIVPNRFRVVYQCPNPETGNGQVQFIRLTDGPMFVWVDEGGANPAFVDLTPPFSATTRVVSPSGDRVTFSYRGLINGNTQSVFGTVSVDSVHQTGSCQATSQALLSG